MMLTLGRDREPIIALQFSKGAHMAVFFIRAVNDLPPCSESMAFLWDDYSPESVGMAFLSQRVPGHLTTINMRDHHGRRLEGRCTHPQAPLHQWVGKGWEGYSAYAGNSDVPDGLFACLLVGYSVQEWAFVLWNRLGRQF
jgi:hypothetical protein